jgi:hypothetical protein
VLQRQTQAAAYWTTAFQVTRADVEYLFSQFLEDETPLSSRELALRLIKHRITQEEENLRKQIARGELFQPRAAYQIGQELIFPAFDFAVGKVIGQRQGQNSEYGDFTVIEVEFEDKRRREFASTLQKPHALNLDKAGGQTLHSLPPLDAETIFAQHGEGIVEELEARLIDEEDAIYFADKWFLRSLLADVNVGHLHLAEAVLDINNGGPLPASVLLGDIDLPKEAPQMLREFSLNVAMSSDERFDDVGPAGQVLWYLRRLEPPEVLKMPQRLVYRPIDYDHSVLSDELLVLERELDDEYSSLEPLATRPSEATLTLIYPHRRAGTLPLTSRVQAFFPTAYETRRIRVTLIDGQSGVEFAGWVVREDRYVYGLGEFYRRHRLPIGAMVTVKATDDPSRLIIDFEAHRPRTEYIRLAVPAEGRLTFANFKRSIGAGYDELLILGAEDLEGVDAIGAAGRDRRRSLVDIMRDLIPELARLNPQNAVHAKTLYSAVNVVRRCPPGPIFAALISRPEFQHVGGPYWRLSS